MHGEFDSDGSNWIELGWNQLSFAFNLFSNEGIQSIKQTYKKTAIQNTIIPQATSFIQSILNVIPVSGSLILSNGTCGPDGGVDIPSSYSIQGVQNSDIVIMVTARPTTYE